VAAILSKPPSALKSKTTRDQSDGEVGRVAAGARICRGRFDATNAPITPANDDVLVVSSTFASPVVVAAREGDVAPGTTASTFSKFKSLVVPENSDGSIIFDATLTQGVDGVTSANDEGLWAYLPHAGAFGAPIVQPLVREGDVVDFGSGNETVLKINAFRTVAGSADQQRVGRGDGHVLVLLQTRVGTNRPRTRVVSLSLVPSVPPL